SSAERDKLVQVTDSSERHSAASGSVAGAIASRCQWSPSSRERKNCESVAVSADQSPFPPATSSLNSGASGTICQVLPASVLRRSTLDSPKSGCRSRSNRVDGGPITKSANGPPGKARQVAASSA